jgi:alpha-galactosidase
MYRGWFAHDYDEKWRASDFTGAPLCLGEPKATDRCIEMLRTLVRENKLDLLEHDQVIVLDDCVRADHAHTAGSRSDAAYHAARGYYRVYDALRREFPDLLLEDCVNGGHMIDYGVLQRCHYISITDNYTPLSNRRAFYDASYALPPAACECYVENAPGKTPANFRYMLRSGMMGWCTIMTDTSQWTAEQHAIARRQFEIYKTKLRPLIRSANLYHVSDRPDGVRWDGMQYFDHESGQGALYAFRGTTADEPVHRFVLKGLDASASYELSFEDGSSPRAVMRGADLMSAGVTVQLPEPESSDLIYLQRAR